MAKGHHVRFFHHTPANVDTVRGLKFVEGENYSFELLWEAGDDFDYKKHIPAIEDQDEHEINVADMILAGFSRVPEFMPRYLAAYERYKPDVIIADPVLSNPFISAHLLGIPVCGTVTFPGFSVIPFLIGKDTDEEREAALESFKKAGVVAKSVQQLKEAYNLDYFEHFTPSANSFSPTSLSICTGVPEFDAEIPKCVKSAGDLLHVGPMVLTEEEGHISVMKDAKGTNEANEDEGPFPFDEIRQQKDKGKTIVYLSFGTVVTKAVWNEEAVTPGKLLGGRQSGKKFCQVLWKRAMDALGGNPEYFVVASGGPHYKEEGVILGEIPSNFLFRSRCPQVEILNGVADIFITHGGANSMMESIVAEVPVLVLPHLGDQFQNGAICEREGVGFAVDDPVADCSEELLQNLLHKIGSRMAEHKTNLRRLKSSLTSAGGAQAAAAAIEAYVKNFKGHAKITSEPLEILPRCGTGSLRDEEPDSLRLV